jgi:hypothetical protein
MNQLKEGTPSRVRLDRDVMPGHVIGNLEGTEFDLSQRKEVFQNPAKLGLGVFDLLPTRKHAICPFPIVLSESRNFPPDENGPGVGLHVMDLRREGEGSQVPTQILPVPHRERGKVFDREINCPLQASLRFFPYS